MRSSYSALASVVNSIVGSILLVAVSASGAPSVSGSGVSIFPNPFTSLTKTWSAGWSENIGLEYMVNREDGRPNDRAARIIKNGDNSGLKLTDTSGSSWGVLEVIALEEVLPPAAPSGTVIWIH